MNYKKIKIIVICMFFLLYSINLYSYNKKINIYNNLKKNQLYEYGKLNLKLYNLNDSIIIFEKIVYEYPFDKKIYKYKLILSYLYYEDRKYDMSLILLNNIIDLYNWNFLVDYCYYLRSLIYLKMNKYFFDSFFKINKSKRDVRYFFNSYIDWIYINDYKGNSFYLFDVKRKIIEFNDFFASYEFYIISYYFEKKKYYTVIKRIGNFLLKFPNSIFIDNCLVIMAKSYYYLSFNDLANDIFRILKIRFNLYNN